MDVFLCLDTPSLCIKGELEIPRSFVLSAVAPARSAAFIGPLVRVCLLSSSTVLPQ